MYKYEEPSLFSGKRGLAFIVVILFQDRIMNGLLTGAVKE